MSQDYKKPLVTLDKTWSAMTNDERRHALTLLKEEFDKTVGALVVDINRTFEAASIPLRVELEAVFSFEGERQGGPNFTSLTDVMK